LYPIYFRDERSRLVKMPDGKLRESVWWLDGDRRCEESVAVKGIVCSRVYRLGADLRYCLEGSDTCDWVVRVVPGNPENY
jgi:hypothetical protein